MRDGHSGSDRERPVVIARSGTQRARPSLLCRPTCNVPSEVPSAWVTLGGRALILPSFILLCPAKDFSDGTPRARRPLGGSASALPSGTLRAHPLHAHAHVGPVGGQLGFGDLADGFGSLLAVGRVTFDYPLSGLDFGRCYRYFLGHQLSPSFASAPASSFDDTSKVSMAAATSGSVTMMARASSPACSICSTGRARVASSAVCTKSLSSSSRISASKSVWSCALPNLALASSGDTPSSAAHRRMRKTSSRFDRLSSSTAPRRVMSWPIRPPAKASTGTPKASKYTAQVGREVTR